MELDDVLLKFDGVPPSVREGAAATKDDGQWLRAQVLRGTTMVRLRFEGPVGLDVTFFGPHPVLPTRAGSMGGLLSHALQSEAEPTADAPDHLPLWGQWQIRETTWRHVVDTTQWMTVKIRAVRRTLDIEPIVFAWNECEFQMWRVFRVPNMRIPEIAGDARLLVEGGYTSASASRVGPIGDEREYETFFGELRQRLPGSPQVQARSPQTPSELE